ncbi:MAG TPA: hypothetical protein VEO54_00220 [Thermoanaerobaculia bacterium]|nr:hypothetical protein [Thermoanaerobaculia bacterium]
MTRRLTAVAAVLVLTALSARAADPARSRDAALPLAERESLRALFDLAPGVIETDDGETVTAFAMEVVVARIGPDGELIKGCVGSAEEARKFFAAPIEKLQKAEGHDH